MDSSSFHEVADAFLEALVDAMEAADESGDLDVEYMDGVLNIILPNESEYTINKHEPSTQIWMSSPMSGASRYHYEDSDDEWLNDDEENLKEKLADEIMELADLDITF